MADLYICSECSRTFRTADSFVNHSEITGHGWADTSDEKQDTPTERTTKP